MKWHSGTVRENDVTEREVATLAAIAKSPEWLLLVNDGQDFRVVRSITIYPDGVSGINLANGDSYQDDKFCFSMFIAAKPVSSFVKMMEPAGEDVELEKDVDSYPMF